MCVRLPRLPLEALGVSMDADRPLAVMSEEGGHPTVHLAGRLATGAGVRRGQSLNTALALAPGLEALRRRPTREQELLATLGEWAGRFSPLVSLEPPDALLLEVRGSLRLFRGLDRLHRLVSEGLVRRGHRARVVAAPTPLAALWLSHGGETLVSDAGELPRHLNPLPAGVTGWSGKTIAALDGIGVTTLGQCRRLPREGFARRFGRDCLRTLDRAYGSQPDPRAHFLAPLRFTDQLDLTEESLDEALLGMACSRLLSGLQEFLLRHQRAARRLRFRFFHLRGEATVLTLGFSAPGRDVAHWEGLLKTRLERLRLPAPVVAVGLATGRLEPLHERTAALSFTDERREVERTASLRLVESLRARLGEEAVVGLRMLPEHRPHQAWDAVDPVHGPATVCADVSPWWRLEEVPPEVAGLRYGGSLLLQRPLWMLRNPQPLGVHDGRPRHGGPLDILSGPERIETGWWDGSDTARDYYVAATGEGLRLWLYQDRRDQRWYLQGIFG